MEQKNDKLFQEFPVISTEEWEEKIQKDLKGADYEKKLVWKTMEGFDVKPYYRSEDLKDLEYMDISPSQFPFLRGNKTNNNDWEIRQDIFVKDIEGANKQALNALMNGSPCPV